MATTRRHQAVHDFVTHTTVQLSPSVDAEASDFHLTRPDKTAVMPSRLRRAAAMLIYLVIVFFAYGVAVLAVVPKECLDTHSCSGGAQLASNALLILWIGASVGVVIGAWRGLLPGARARRVSVDDAALIAP
jgi:hypothetical protein